MALRGSIVLAMALAALYGARLSGQDSAPTPAAPTAPARSQHYPPLCTEDVLGLLEQSIALLEAAGEEEEGEAVDSPVRNRALQWITSAREYSELLENRHSSLGSFTWLRLGVQRTLGRQVDRLPLPTAVSNVAALAFEATGGDIWLESVIVTTGDDVRTTTALTVKRWIFQDMPWTAAAFLPEGARVWDILTDRRAWEGRAELTVFGGVARRGFQDYGRRALHYMERAENQLTRDNRANALDALRQAQEMVTRFHAERMEQLQPAQSWIFGRTGRK